MSKHKLVTVKANPRATCVTIGIASSGRACPLDLVLGIALQTFPANTGVGWSVVVGKNVDEARNKIVDDALSYGSKYLWFVDDDTVPPFDAARKLMYVLEQEEARGSKVMVCSGIYGRKQEPSEPLVFQGPNESAFWKWKEGEVFDCWGTGAGCLMIRTELFKHLEKPYFKFIQEPGYTEGEDLYFFRHVAEAGFKVRAHGGVMCGHWDIGEMKVYSIPSDSYPMEKTA